MRDILSFAIYKHLHKKAGSNKRVDFSLKVTSGHEWIAVKLLGGFLQLEILQVSSKLACIGDQIFLVATFYIIA
jgi:hypothetical protein